MIKLGDMGWYFQFGEGWYGPMHYEEAEIGLELANESGQLPVERYHHDYLPLGCAH